MKSAEAMAKLHPNEALKLLRRVPPAYIKTRAEMAGIIAQQFGRARPNELRMLLEEIGQYVDSEMFTASISAARLGATVSHIERGALRCDSTPQKSRTLGEMDPTVRAKLLLDCALSVQGSLRYAKLLEAAKALDKTSKRSGANWIGQAIWPDEIRERLIEALVCFDPKAALDIALAYEGIPHSRGERKKYCVGRFVRY